VKNVFFSKRRARSDAPYQYGLCGSHLRGEKSALVVKDSCSFLFKLFKPAYRPTAPRCENAPMLKLKLFNQRFGYAA
jgi:hypothetical protein